MRAILIYVAICISHESLADVTSLHFCADMNPQRYINIEQLMGMWYGIEIITHPYEEVHYVQIDPSCPILHLSEDKSYHQPPATTTISPYYRNYDYQHNYGERRRNPSPRPYDTINTNSPYLQNYNGRRYGDRRYQPEELKRLRIWWDQNGSGTEYHLIYNVTQPGFWRSSGPSNGSELEEQFASFAGTVQVIKAVGNHLVLTFCHQLPDRQLFTIILGRKNRLDESDLHGVHSLLNRRGLSTSAIKKVCNAANRVDSFGMLFFLIGAYLCRNNLHII